MSCLTPALEAGLREKVYFQIVPQRPCPGYEVRGLEGVDVDIIVSTLRAV